MKQILRQQLTGFYENELTNNILSFWLPDAWTKNTEDILIALPMMAAKW